MAKWTEDQLQVVSNFRAGLLTLGEAAELVGRSKRAVRVAMRRNDLPRAHRAAVVEGAICGYLTPGTSYRCGLPAGHGKHAGRFHYEGLDNEQSLVQASSLD